MRPAVLVPALVLVLGATAEYPAPVPQSIEQQKSSILLSLPNVLHAGSDIGCNYLFNLRNFAEPLDKLALNFTTDDNHPLFSVEKDLSQTNGENNIDCLQVPVPLNLTDHKGAKVSLGLTTSQGLFTTETKKIRLNEATPPIKLVVQDKPQYRPGDHAHFQLILLDWRLRPHRGTDQSQTVSEAWVTNSDGLRVAQWRDTPLKYGVASFNLHIAEEFVPPARKLSTTTEDGSVMSNWKIHYKTADFYHTENFHVGDVAPAPIFDIDITSPESVTSRQRTVTITVCASYKFGVPLVGAFVNAENMAPNTINVNGTWKAFEITDSRGCATLDMLISDKNRRGLSFDIPLNVTDPASGVVEQRAVTIRRGSREKVLEQAVTFWTVPANLSRTLVYRVKYADGVPATNELVEICTQAMYYPPTRSAGWTVRVPGNEWPLADFTYLLPRYELNKLSPELREELESLPLLWKVSPDSSKGTARDCTTVKTDSEGIAKLKMTEFAQRVHSVKITAKRQSDWRGQDEYLSVMTSPSSSYLALDIAQMPVKLPCHGDIRLPLLSTLPKESLVVQLQVMSRNRVVASEIAHLATDELVLHMVPEMSPKTRLLVYSQLESGEVMADTVEMDVETCFPNEVTASWTASKAEPNGAAELVVTAEPNSRCTVAVKDAGLGLRKRGRHPYELTREGALDVFRNLDHNLHPPPMDLNDRCKALEQKLFESLLRAGVNSSSLDILIKGFSNLDRYRDRKTSFRAHPHADTAEVFRWAGMVPLATGRLHFSPCVKYDFPPWSGYSRYTRSVGDYPIGYGHSGSHDQDVFLDTRQDVIHHESHTLDERGIGHVTLRLPGRATRWVATATCTHPQKGFGISEKVSIRATRLLFADMSIPHSVKTGEVLTVPVTVFNNYDSHLSVDVTLDDPSHIYHGPGSGNEEVTQHLCIASHDTGVARWKLQFPELVNSRNDSSSYISVTVTEDKTGRCGRPNTVHPSRITIEKPIVIRPDGYLREDARSHLICLDSGKYYLLCFGL
ncbi:murinoglobulin-1-like [Amphibalanus amphitrite]|uniref:murinoglobulin-1-like n=1 Tax=Amphibalanus amphitrite TaxID=1232801 RepID=UPI001C909E38|nr:murinoglobulin-1-like [Amphibalanus amphitrite]